MLIRLFALCAALAIVGCGRINSENYRKVQPGWTQQQVEQVLGGGMDTAQLCRGPSMSIDEPGADHKCIRYGDSSRYILVRYEQRKVVDKQKEGL